jgi:transcriptional regulator with XRE-family HTH domain
LRGQAAAVSASSLTPAEQFAENVQRIRNQRGWTKEEAAWACGLDATAYGRIESGERKPTLLTIFKLSSGLEAKPADLFAGID